MSPPVCARNDAAEKGSAPGATLMHDPRRPGYGERPLQSGIPRSRARLGQRPGERQWVLRPALSWTEGSTWPPIGTTRTGHGGEGGPWFSRSASRSQHRLAFRPFLHIRAWSETLRHNWIAARPFGTAKTMRLWPGSSHASTHCCRIRRGHRGAEATVDDCPNPVPCLVCVGRRRCRIRPGPKRAGH